MACLVLGPSVQTIHIITRGEPFAKGKWLVWMSRLQPFREVAILADADLSFTSELTSGTESPAVPIAFLTSYLSCDNSPLVGHFIFQAFPYNKQDLVRLKKFHKHMCQKNFQITTHFVLPKSSGGFKLPIRTNLNVSS